MTDLPVLAPLTIEEKKPKGPAPIAKCGLCKALFYRNTKECGAKHAKERGWPISCPLQGPQWQALKKA